MINYLAKHDRESGFPYLINLLSLYTGIEIGVRESFFARHLLENSQLTLLYGLEVEPKWHYVGHTQTKFAPRYVFIEGKSPDYAEKFADATFDFIYIDASHKYEAVKADLTAWYPKLCVGGVYAGDDYWNSHDEHGNYGVIQAVNEFVVANNQELFITGTTDGPNAFEKFAKHAQYNLDTIQRGGHNPNWYFIKK